MDIQDDTKTVTIETESFKLSLTLKGSALMRPTLDDIDTEMRMLLKGSGYHPYEDEE